MRWEIFLQKKELYKKVWGKLKNEFTGDDRKFLESSYLVIHYKHAQIGFSTNDIASVAIEHPEFIVKNRNSTPMLKLAEEYRKAKKRNSESAKDIYSEMRRIDAREIEVAEYRVEIIFPTVAIERIQRLKRSKYVDQKLTDMRKVSIRVILEEI